MNHHSLFSDKADLYARARPSYPEEMFSYLGALCDETQLAWDCACGNGQAAISLAKQFDLVLASDVSLAQINNAKAHPRVQYSVGACEKVRFDDSSLDLVCVAQALHWFDFQRFWPQVLRVLKPRGIFTAFGYNLPSINVEIDELIRQYLLDVVEPYWATQNKLLWDGYKAIDFPFRDVRQLDYTMSKAWTLDELFAFLHTFSATRRCMAMRGDDFFKSAYKEVQQKWLEPELKKIVSFELVVYVCENPVT